MAKLELRVEKTGNSVKCILVGDINEDVLFDMNVFSGVSRVDIDLKNVSGINSCGIREWVKWMQAAKATPLYFFECPKVFIDQVNMVDGFLPPNGKIMSFYVPYFCEESESEKIVLYTFGKEYDDSGLRPPREVKDDRGMMMEMDVIAAKYFKFLKLTP